MSKATKTGTGKTATKIRAGVASPKAKAATRAAGGAGRKSGAKTGSRAGKDKAQSAAQACAPHLAKPRAPRADTKQARLVAMLSGAEGASIAEIATALAWQPHTVRGAIAGALKTRLGLAVTSAKEEGRGRVHRIAVG